MIIVKLFGGLGNQMFQYAAGYALAQQFNTNLFLDIRMYQKFNMHNGFELNRVFNNDIFIANKKIIKQAIGWHYYLNSKLLSNLFNFYRHDNLLTENNLLSHNKLILKNDYYLNGYWQSEKFFLRYKDHVLKQFEFKKPLTKKNLNISRLINNSINSVSIHVRRGDYVATLKNKSVHDVCTLSYYQKAIELIESKLNNPTYFIFSDDISWAKGNLNIRNNFYYIDSNKKDDSYNDMRLMSLCDHNIIANSSFSWWGAWLNKNKNKIVISPDRWFANNNNTTIIPDSWQVVQS